MWFTYGGNRSIGLMEGVVGSLCSWGAEISCVRSFRRPKESKRRGSNQMSPLRYRFLNNKETLKVIDKQL